MCVDSSSAKQRKNLVSSGMSLKGEEMRERLLEGEKGEEVLSPVVIIPHRVNADG